MDLWNAYLCGFHSRLRVTVHGMYSNQECKMYVNLSGEHTQFHKNFRGVNIHVMCYVVLMYLHSDQQIGSILSGRVLSDKTICQVEWYTACVTGLCTELTMSHCRHDRQCNTRTYYPETHPVIQGRSRNTVSNCDCDELCLDECIRLWEKCPKNKDDDDCSVYLLKKCKGSSCGNWMQIIRYEMHKGLGFYKFYGRIVLVRRGSPWAGWCSEGQCQQDGWGIMWLLCLFDITSCCKMDFVKITGFLA